MDDAVIKFSGWFTLRAVDLSGEWKVPTQILYKQDHHIIVIYDYKNTVMPAWLDAIITGVITYYNLDTEKTVAMACTCDILGPDEKEPEDNVVHEIIFTWADDIATVKSIKELNNEDL